MAGIGWHFEGRFLSIFRIAMGFAAGMALKKGYSPSTPVMKRCAPYRNFARSEHARDKD
jgi:hypothetical protein